MPQRCQSLPVAWTVASGCSDLGTTLHTREERMLDVGTGAWLHLLGFLCEELEDWLRFEVVPRLRGFRSLADPRGEDCVCIQVHSRQLRHPVA